MSFPVDLLSYVTRFQWDKARYPTTLPLSSLTELISKVQTDGKKEKKIKFKNCLYNLGFQLWVERVRTFYELLRLTI